MTTPSNAVPGRLRWRCRRGMRELDFLLTGFVDAHWQQLNQIQRSAFDRLLNTQDPTLMDWVMGRARPADAVIADLIDRIVVNAGNLRH